jgi:methyl-accepting chemotaxis protein
LLLVVLLAITPTIALAIYSHVAGLGLRLGPDLIGLVATFTLVLPWLGGDLFIVRRARALIAATHRLTEGDLSARSGVPYGRGEIGQLARAFDQMAAGLELRDRITREAERTLLTTVEVLRETDEQRQRLLARLDHAQE